MEFPKIIHQIWLQGIDVIPSKYINNIETIKQFNPDYQHIIWDEKSILEIINTNDSWKKTYFSFKHLHQKVDYARYVILWLKGGLYIDIDVTALK